MMYRDDWGSPVPAQRWNIRELSYPGTVYTLHCQGGGGTKTGPTTTTSHGIYSRSRLKILNSQSEHSSRCEMQSESQTFCLIYKCGDWAGWWWTSQVFPAVIPVHGNNSHLTSPQSTPGISFTPHHTITLLAPS